MATIVGNNQVKLDNGKTIAAEQGAWYDGQQFWGGTLSAKGVINPLSNQQGAGQKVSSEVNQQSSVAQGLAPNAIDTYLNKPITPPKSANSVTPYLASYQNSLFGDGGGPETRVQSLDEIAKGIKDSGLLPSNPPPTPPSLVEQFGALKEQAGVDAIQQSIIDLKSQQDAIATQLQVNKTAENGKPVAKNVIEGRVSQETQQAQDQYDFIGRQLSRKQDELNAALSNIQMIMQFSQTDYQNASQAYNTQFDQAISMINLVRGIQQDQKTEQQRAIDNARANAQIFVNAIQKGNLDINSLDPAAQAQLNTLEVQAGLPVGFFGALHMDANANVLFTSTDNGVTQVGIRNADGSISVQKYGTPTGGGSGDYKPGSAGFITVGKQSISAGLQAAANSYGDVSPSTWQAAMSAWIGDGLGNKQDFINNFSQYADTNRGDFSKAYGFDKDTGKVFNG